MVNAATRRSTTYLGQWLLIAVLTLLIVLLYTGYVRLNNCINTYAHHSQAAQRARVDAATKNDRAVDKMVEDVLAADDAGDTRRALEEYRQTRAEVIATQKANPVPTPPDHC